jgi:hypothetical protein
METGKDAGMALVGATRHDRATKCILWGMTPEIQL